MAYFDHLNYGLGEEDTTVELKLMPHDARHVLVVAGSGSRVMPLLARQPRRVTCVDVSSQQLALTECRLAALRAMERCEYMAFLGYPPRVCAAHERAAALASLPVSSNARDQLRRLFARTAWKPPIYAGRFEKMMRRLSRINRALTGSRAAGIFDTSSLEEQQRYFREHFPQRAWRAVLFLLANSTVLNSILYRGQFPRKNVPGRTRAIYEAIFRRLLYEQPVRESFFLQLAFLGELRFAEGNPVECDEGVFASAKRGTATVDFRLQHGDVFAVAGATDTPIDFVSLSDVPSFLRDEPAKNYLQLLKPHLAPNAIVVARGHLRVVSPASTGYDDLGAQYRDLFATEKTQLWTIQAHRLRA